MKRWIVETLTSLAGIFGWKVPGWIIRLVPQDELQAMARREEALTQALQRGEPRSHSMPAFLEARIDRAIVEAEQPRESIPWRSWLVLPATAIAAIVVIGFFLFGSIQQRDSSLPETGPVPQVAVVDSKPAPLPLEQVVSGIPNLKETAMASDLLLRPLAREKARLTSDVTSALRFVAHSVLPESYMERVNENLDSLEQEYGNPI